MVSRCGGHRSVDSAQWKHCYVLALSATILVKMNLNTQNAQLELMNNTREPSVCVGPGACVRCRVCSCVLHLQACSKYRFPHGR